MTGAVLERPGSLFEEARRPADGRPLTLEERLSDALHAVRTEGAAECPVCKAHMTPGADVAAIHGTAACSDCGSRLS